MHFTFIEALVLSFEINIKDNIIYFNEITANLNHFKGIEVNSKK